MMCCPTSAAEGFTPARMQIIASLTTAISSPGRLKKSARPCFPPKRASSSSITMSRFGGEQGIADFFKRPGEVIAVVSEAIICILAGVKPSAALVGQHIIHPADDALSSFAQERIVRHLPAVQIIFEQLRIVVAHFFE